MATIGQRDLGKTVIADIEYAGKSITLPDDPDKMPIADAIKALEMRALQEGRTVIVSVQFDAAPWDTANAVWIAMREVYGWATPIPTPGFFSSRPPEMVTVETGFQTYTQVPWGRIALPSFGEDEYFDLGIGPDRDGMFVGTLRGRVEYRHREEVDRLAEKVREVLRERSIYRGKAFKVRFPNEDEDASQPVYPQFLNVTNSDPKRLIFRRDLEEAIETNLYAPIRLWNMLSTIGEKFRRGVALVGFYGTGKTEIALTAANIAEQSGVTFVYLERARDLAQGILWARKYEPAILFLEDVDRVTSGVRDENLDAILNAVDGLDTKKSQVMLVATSNNVESIHPAMKRPGRFDVFLETLPPDQEATERLIRYYAGPLLSSAEDVSPAARIQAGKIPALTKEMVTRAKMAQFRRTGDVNLTCEALHEAAQTMQMQEELLYRPAQVKRSDLENAATLLGNFISEAIQRNAKPVITRAEVATIVNEAFRGSVQPGLTLPSAELEHAANYTGDDPNAGE